MDNLLAPDHALHCSAGPGPPRSILTRPFVKFGMAGDGCEMKGFAIVGSDVPAFRLTQPQGLFEHRVEYWPEIALRRVDDLQYFGSGGLLLQCLSGLGDQPRVFDRDDRLVGKGTHQLDLPLGERFHPKTVKCDDADWLALAQEWHPKYGASPGRQNLGHRVLRVSADVCDMHDPAFESHPPGDSVATGDNGSLA